MTTRDRLFLIVFDRYTSTPAVEDLGHDLSAAMKTYADRERELAGSSNLEVVLLGAPSIESLRRTHSSYFGAGESLTSALAAASD